jgi:hypothetical protein
MTANDFPLQEVPDRLFDSALWSELKRAAALWCHHSGMAYRDAAALEALRPDSSSFMAFARHDPDSWKNPVVAAQIRVAELRDRLLADLTNKLTSAELVATGLVPPDPTRLTISANLWSELNLIIPDGVAAGRRFKFDDVRVVCPAPPPRDRAAAHVDWFRAHLSGIQDLTKKEIRAKAEVALGADFTVSDFKAAYKEIFARKTGRPPKRLTEKVNK